jgi:hypothetical protein
VVSHIKANIHSWDKKCVPHLTVNTVLRSVYTHLFVCVCVWGGGVLYDEVFEPHVVRLCEYVNQSTSIISKWIIPYKHIFKKNYIYSYKSSIFLQVKHT